MDQMFDRILPASFQNIVKADDVAFDVHVGVHDGVPHARLRGEIHDDLRPVSREEVGNQALVGKVAADEREVLERLELCQPRLLEPDVIVVVQIVQPTTCAPGSSVRTRFARFAPINPAAPVMKDGHDSTSLILIF